MMKNDINSHGEQEKTIFSNLEEMLPLIEECLANGQSVKFSPRGISMLPLLRQGKDSVSLSKPPQKLKKFDIPLYRRKDGSFVLHRVVKVGETYTCIGDNQFIFEKGIEHDQIIALCTSVTRDGKTMSIYSMKWRLYAIFWHYSRFPRRVWRAVCRRFKKLLQIGKV